MPGHALVQRLRKPRLFVNRGLGVLDAPGASKGKKGGAGVEAGGGAGMEGMSRRSGGVRENKIMSDEYVGSASPGDDDEMLTKPLCY